MCTNLLWGNVEGQCPHVDLLVAVDAGHDEEDPWAASAPTQEAAKAEDDDTLVLLNNLRWVKGEGGRGTGGSRISPAAMKPIHSILLVHADLDDVALVYLVRFIPMTRIYSHFLQKNTAATVAQRH